MQLITTTEAAERLGVQVLIRVGRLPARLIGGIYIIEESDLALVADRKPGRPKKAETGVFARLGDQQDSTVIKSRANIVKMARKPAKKGGADKRYTAILRNQ